VAEEAQEVVVENAGQPLVASIEIAYSDEIAEQPVSAVPTNQTIEIEPATD